MSRSFVGVAWAVPQWAAVGQPLRAPVATAEVALAPNQPLTTGRWEALPSAPYLLQSPLRGRHSGAGLGGSFGVVAAAVAGCCCAGHTASALAAPRRVGGGRRPGARRWRRRHRDGEESARRPWSCDFSQRRATASAAGVNGGGAEASSAGVQALAELSEEELLAYELAEHDLDLDLDENEEEEWRCYDEEVQQFQEFMEAASESDTASAVLDGDDAQGTDVADGSFDLSSGGSSGSSSSAGASSDVMADSAATSALAALAIELRRSLAPAPASLPTPAWSPGGQSALEGFSLPSVYRKRLAEGVSGVVVIQNLGPNTVVLLSRVPDQPELLPVLSETFRLLRVRILRGWLEATDGAVTNAFEVCDARTGETLTPEDAKRLEKALVQALRAPAARAVLFEVDDQLPRLDAFFGLPAGGSRPPSLPAARGALLGSPFRVFEARDLGRVLVFRGELDLEQSEEDGTSLASTASEALDCCRQRLEKVSAPGAVGRWECFLIDGASGQNLLVLLPLEDLEEVLAPPFDQIVAFFFCLGAAALIAQASAPTNFGSGPAVGALILSIFGAGELNRRAVASSYGVRFGLPLLLPSPALGTFGACSRALTAVPDAAARFDIALSALVAALLASLILILVGVLTPPEGRECAWVNPGIFPNLLQQLVYSSAESHGAFCPTPPDAAARGAVPVDPALVAGCFGALATALNALPLGRLDGASIVAAIPWASIRENFLPGTALVILGSATLSSDADGLFPLVLVFAFVNLFIRPQLSPELVLRDNVTKLEDVPRLLASLVLTCVALTLLLPIDLSGFLFSGSSLSPAMQ
eukprot:CAMPEP_0204164030 /NCGR_PEP_ID=MMETSP0361-20130328/36907_1 /ASSEMBLY_ACC=CAM_ASM_000343 /TAXON_ID=268821 /ORGANISM="Scrippsiella Hangoei, Strain SHTV-5" /LENGTH=816 /DNA_ID=CAMNT_0051120819 /DNA_START=15 /DNA_END=2465 /DNA_ORIENTATION=+